MDYKGLKLQGEKEGKQTIYRLEGSKNGTQKGYMLNEE